MQTKQYAVYIADTDLARTIHHHIRYRVYCERKQYENPIDAGIPEEHDSYDPFATHFIVRNGAAKTWQGTARLIMPSRAELPIQKMGALYPDIEKSLLDSSVAEFSRLAALPSSWPASRNNRHILQATIAGLLDYSHLHGIEHWVFLVSLGLARILTRIGIPMEACGPTIEHRGKRRAFSLSVTHAIRDVSWAREHLSVSERLYSYCSESVFAHEGEKRWAHRFFGSADWPQVAPAL